jgi:hypothetical protein
MLIHPSACEAPDEELSSRGAFTVETAQRCHLASSFGELSCGLAGFRGSRLAKSPNSEPGIWDGISMTVEIR